MLKSITHSSVFVLDQNEALEFYVGKLGLEVGADVDMGFMRWLTVNVPGERPPDPARAPEPASSPTRRPSRRSASCVTKGALGLGFIVTTDDCRRDYEALKAKGVEFTEEPTEHFYGVDCGFRDPFGNQCRLTQPNPNPVYPEPGEFSQAGSAPAS